ncbi:GGDEF domain-containing protein [Deinococcus cellulosilyticus NBRC 106333 = KACC 11606]|uniref:GGDEF domain-containing protein n=1 Tax=Deinococcus cellulosilyticus (strain DSM 18568 / NBRC 106333 / KACC 11606 / 5516J-15) TaxID=1223518 RepID=A0A511MVP0_DEIC1|nr:GGDEF domain-containing protein [Deinococcus cellulosilyticus NBRC 106333 = KACC 11606]
MLPSPPSSVFVQRFKKPLYQTVTLFAFLVCLLGAFFSRSHPQVYGWMAVLFLGSNLYLTFSKEPNIRLAERLNLLLGTLLCWYQIYTASFLNPVGLEGFFVMFAMTSLSVVAFSYHRALQVIAVQAGVGILAPWVTDLFFNVLTGREWLYIFSMEAIVLACVVLQTAVAWFKAQFDQEEARRLMLQEQASTDPLTGARNRRAMLEQLQAAQFEESCLVLLDIDHFKRINDQHGHNTGDDVLREMAVLLQAHVQDPHQVSRWGGEEFLVLLPQTPVSDGLRIAEQIRLDLERHDFPGVRQVTASLGVAAAQPAEPVRAWIHRADQALYQAKRGGRNQVKLAGETSELMVSGLQV